MVTIGDYVKVIDQDIRGEIVEDYGNTIVLIDEDSEYSAPDDRLEFKKSEVEIIWKGKRKK